MVSTVASKSPMSDLLTSSSLTSQSSSPFGPPTNPSRDTTMNRMTFRMKYHTNSHDSCIRAFKSHPYKILQLLPDSARWPGCGTFFSRIRPHPNHDEDLIHQSRRGCRSNGIHSRGLGRRSAEDTLRIRTGLEEPEG